MSGWHEVHNAQHEYLNSKVVPITVRTLLLSKDQPIFKTMIKWCEKSRNVKGSWGPEQDDDMLVYFNFWQNSEAKKFMKRFKKYIDNPPTTTSV